MNSITELKQKLYNACQHNLNKRRATIESSLASIEESRNNETKSSAGDKHNTARAMMQIEENKAKRQLGETLLKNQELQKINTELISTKAQLGSLIFTTKGTYYISIGIGKVNIEEDIYYCLSPNSPIGLQLLGKCKEDEILFNGNSIRILEVY